MSSPKQTSTSVATKKRKKSNDDANRTDDDDKVTADYLVSIGWKKKRCVKAWLEHMDFDPESDDDYDIVYVLERGKSNRLVIEFQGSSGRATIKNDGMSVCFCGHTGTRSFFEQLIAHL